MREYGKVSPQFWVDHRGRKWPVSTSTRRPKYKYPAHAAMRAYVFHRDGYKCCRCPAKAAVVPEDYTGHDTLFTDTILKSGYPDMLIVDHVLTLKAGGRNVVDNFQTLCETCNKRKQKEDRAAAEKHRGSV